MIETIEREKIIKTLDAVEDAFKGDTVAATIYIAAALRARMKSKEQALTMLELIECAFEN